MAIQLVPKSSQGAESKVTGKEVVYYLLLGLALFVTFSFLYLHFVGSKMDKETVAIERKLLESRSGEFEELERSILKAETKVSLFSKFLDSHKKNSFFFDYLSTLCHKEVFFTHLNLNADNATAELDGKTEDFARLRQQILILRSEEEIKEVKLKSVSINQERGIDFSLNLSFDSSILKEGFKKETEE